MKHFFLTLAFLLGMLAVPAFAQDVCMFGSKADTLNAATTSVAIFSGKSLYAIDQTIQAAGNGAKPAKIVEVGIPIDENGAPVKEMVGGVPAVGLLLFTAEGCNYQDHPGMFSYDVVAKALVAAVTLNDKVEVIEAGKGI